MSFGALYPPSAFVRAGSGHGNSRLLVAYTVASREKDKLRMSVDSETRPLSVLVTHTGIAHSTGGGGGGDVESSSRRHCGT